MDVPRAKRLLDYLDDYPESVRNVARAVLTAELGKLHMQVAMNIKQEIRAIVEKEVERARSLAEEPS